MRHSFYKGKEQEKSRFRVTVHSGNQDQKKLSQATKEGPRTKHNEVRTRNHREKRSSNKDHPKMARLLEDRERWEDERNT